MSEKIKVMLVDDEQLIRSGLKIMLETYPDIEVIIKLEMEEKHSNVVKSRFQMLY